GPVTARGRVERDGPRHAVAEEPAERRGRRGPEVRAVARDVDERRRGDLPVAREDGLLLHVARDGGDAGPFAVGAEREVVGLDAPVAFLVLADVGRAFGALV